VMDDRERYATRDRFPEAERVEVGVFESAAEKARVTPRTFVVIVTRGHKGDAAALASCLPLKPRFLGLLGSRSKMAHIYADLVERGFGSEDLGRIETPVGIEIGAETPEEIAVSIVARMIAVRRGVSAERIRPMGAGLPGRFAAIQSQPEADSDRRNDS